MKDQRKIEQAEHETRCNQLVEKIETKDSQIYKYEKTIG
jgi:hypothetical protein